MVQIIDENRKRTFGEKILSGANAALPGVESFFNKRSQSKALKGQGIDPNLPPELQKLVMQYKMMGNLERDKLNEKDRLRRDLIGDIESPEKRGNLTVNFDNEIRQDIEDYQRENGLQFSPEEKEMLFDRIKGSSESNSYQNNQDFSPDFSKAKKYAAAGEHDLSNVSTKEENARIKQFNEGKKEVRESFKDNKDFINRSYDQYEDSLRKDAILSRMNELEDTGELSNSGAYNFLEKLGFKPEWLKNPGNEEYTKLGLDLLGGGTLQADYGSRVLASEFKVSQQRIPTLSQTPEGRRQISENLKTMLLPAKLKHERMQFYMDQAERTGKPLPHDLRGKVLRDIKPQLEEAYDKFKQRNGRYEVKPGTIADDNDIEKYYYITDGNMEKARKMMKEDGYDI